MQEARSNTHICSSSNMWPFSVLLAGGGVVGQVGLASLDDLSLHLSPKKLAKFHQVLFLSPFPLGHWGDRARSPFRGGRASFPFEYAVSGLPCGQEGDTTRRTRVTAYERACVCATTNKSSSLD